MTEEIEFNIKKEHILYFLLVVAIIISIVPWFTDGISVTDDFRHHVTKFWWMKYSFDTYGHFSEWMPYIYSGWPMTEFYHSLPYFISLPFILLLKPFAALKASIAASFILAAISMFIAARKIFKRNDVACTAAILYIFAPLHFELSYMSGSISRLWAYVLLPVVFAYFISTVDEKTKKNAVIFSALFAALMYTNVNMAIAVSYFLAAYLLYHIFVKEKKIKQSTIMLIGTIILLIAGLSAGWLLPYLSENHDSSTQSITQNIIGSAPAGTPFPSVFKRAFGRDVDGKGDRSFYISYVLLALAILGAYSLKFEHKKIFTIFAIAGVLLALNTLVVRLLPLGGSVTSSTYFLTCGIIFLVLLAAGFICSLGNKNAGFIVLALVVLFLIDVWPAYTTNYWSNQPTENYVNSKEILDAYNFIKEQPGLFRTYSFVGETPYIYTEKQEIGLEWTGYREGAFKPIRDLTDDLYSRATKNITDTRIYTVSGYMGAKYILLPCIQNFDKIIPLAYSNNAICVYENPAFRPIIESPRKIQIGPQPTATDAEGYILEQCFTNCMIEKEEARISNIRFLPEYITFTTTANKESTVIVKVSFFEPRWRAYVDGKQITIRKAWPYYMALDLPEGDHIVELKYELNTIHILGWILSVAAFIWGIYLLRAKST